MPVVSAENLSPNVEALLRPVEVMPDGSVAPSLAPHRFREERLRDIPGYQQIQANMIGRRVLENLDLPYMTTRGIRETYAYTQGRYENHRRLTPRLQEMLHYNDTHAALMEGVDESCLRDTERLLQEAKQNGGQLAYDVTILGSGPHGAATAMMIRELFPQLRILMVDENGLGGLWRSNGPNPSCWMNSRVRRANRRLAPIPRTPGNINPLGFYATLELSDTVKGNYALNTETGDTTALNGYLSIDDALVGVRCQSIVNKGTSAVLTATAENGQMLDVRSGVVVDARGISQISTLNPSALDQVSDAYFNTTGVYRHYGNYKRKPNYQPLQQFNRKDIIVVSPADGALTALDATLGKLPAQTYGSYGPGRYRPNSITWVGAPGQFAAEIDPCLRARYKDTIVQALPKGVDDKGAIIRPIPIRARGFRLTATGVEVTLDSGDIILGDVLFDCTNQKAANNGPVITDARKDPRSSSAVFRVGPGAQRKLEDFPKEIREAIERLLIPENTASLWASMSLTNKAARRAGAVAVRNAI